MSLTGIKDLDIEILIRFEDEDLINYSLTSKYANQLFNDEKLSMRKMIYFFREYGTVYEIIKEKRNRLWKNYYIESSSFIRRYPNLDKGLIKASVEGKLLLMSVGRLSNCYDILE